MSDILIIARREFLQYIRTRGFLLTLFFIPAWFVLGGVFQHVATETKSLRYFAVVDETGRFTGALDLALTADAERASLRAFALWAEANVERHRVSDRVMLRAVAIGGSKGSREFFESRNDLVSGAVENAFGTQGHYGSAIQDWRSQHQHTDFRNAPRGAMVFYNTSSNGHVALSLGDGRVVSSSAHGRVGIVPIDHFQRPLGWAYAPY